MAENYKWIKLNQTVQRLSDGAYIPNATDNKDWQSFQIWLAIQGNTPLAPDPAPTAADVVSDQRAGAIIEILTDPSANAKALRDIILLAMNEFNLLRERDVDRSTDVAAAVSLADLKTRWAARPPLNDRTIGQFQNALQNMLNSGVVD